MLRFMAGLLVALLWCGTQASAATPVEGRDITLVRPAQPTNAKNKVEVIEFFSYRCALAIASNIDFAVQLANVDALISRARAGKQTAGAGK